MTSIPQDLTPSSKEDEMNVSGMFVVRSICDPHETSEDEINAFNMWLGGQEHDTDPDTPVLFGQIVTTNTNETHMLGVTVAMLLSPGPGAAIDPRDPTASNMFLQRWAPWAKHMLWDYAITHLRVLAAGLLVSEVNVSSSTSEPTLMFDNETPGEDDEMPEDGGASAPQ